MMKCARIDQHNETQCDGYVETCMNDNRPARYELFTTIPGRDEGILGPSPAREVRQVVCKQCHDREARRIDGFFFVHTINDLKGAK